MLAGMLVALGVWAFQHQQIDAYPDISGQMVQIITTYPGRAPEEVEKQVTIPLEIAMGTVPRVEKIRSRTIFGLSIVEVLFEEGVENYWARQRVKEKLDEATLPDGVKPDLGALATAYGEIYRYELVSDGTHDLMELRTLQDWVVTPRILRCSGVADVENFGGYLKQYTVTFNPDQLQRYNLSLSDVTDALQSNNSSAGGSVVTRGSMSFVIRGKGSVQDAAEIGAIFIKSVDGTPIYRPRRGRGGTRLSAADRHFQQGPPRRIDRGHRAHAPRRKPLGGARPGQGSRQGTQRPSDPAQGRPASTPFTIARSSWRTRCTPWGTAWCWALPWWSWCCCSSWAAPRWRPWWP